MPTVEELLAQLGNTHPELDALLEQMDVEVSQARQASGQGFMGQLGVGLEKMGTQIAQLPAEMLGLPVPGEKKAVKTPQGFGEKAGRFLGEVAPEVALEAGFVAGTGGLGGAIPLAGQIAGSSLAGGIAGGVGQGPGGAALGAGIGAAVPFGMDKLLKRFGRKAVGEFLELGEDELREVLEAATLRAQDPATIGVDFEDLFMDEANKVLSRKVVPRQTIPPMVPSEIDMTTGNLLPSGEVRQILNLQAGKTPAQLPPGGISFNTLYESAATGHTPAFRNALAMTGASVDEVNAIVARVTTPRDKLGRFRKTLTPEQKGVRYAAELEERVGGRPAGNLPNVDVVESAFRKTTESIPKTPDELVQKEAEEFFAKLPPSEEIPPDALAYIVDMQARGADLTKMGARAKAIRPFLKPAGVGARSHLPNMMLQFDTAISNDMRAAGVPKQYRESIMGISRKPIEGVVPLTQAERVVIGKQLLDGKTSFAQKWKAMSWETHKTTSADIIARGREAKKAAEKAEFSRLKKQLDLEVEKAVKKKGGQGGFLELNPQDIRTDFSPLSGESGVLMLNRLQDSLSPELMERLRGRLKVEDFQKQGNTALTLWYNALLLNPATILRNLVGNTLEFAEQAVTRTVKGALRGSPKQSTAQWSGFGHGLLNAVQSAGEAWRTGVIESIREGTEEFATELPSAMSRKAPASKILSAMDDFYTTLTYHMDLQDRIYRKAAQSTGDTASLISKMNDQVPEELADAAMKAARRVVYRDFAENGIERAVLKATRSFQDIPVFGRLMLPFGPTLFRIGKRVTEYTPMGYFAGAWNVMAGGLGSTQAERGIEQMLRASYGATMMTAVSYLAKNGYITGEMKNVTQNQREAIRAAGTQPMSVKIGNNWVSYRNLGPLTGLFQFVANTVEDIDSGKYTAEEMAFKTPANLMVAAADATFLPNLAQAIGAIVDPDRHGTQGWNNIISYLQPSSGIAALTRAIDPKVREVDKLDPESVFESRVPGLSKSLRPRLGLFGEELSRRATPEGGALEGIENFLSPVARKRVTEDPVIAEVARLKASMGAPSMDLDIPISDEAKWTSSKAMGMLQKKFVTRVATSPFYQNLPDERRKALLEKAHGKARRIINERTKRLVKQGKDITYRALLKGLIAE